MTDTLRVNELEDNELRQQFNSLVEAMVDQQFREEGAHEALNQLIIQAVTDKPEISLSKKLRNSTSNEKTVFQTNNQ